MPRHYRRRFRRKRRGRRLALANTGIRRPRYQVMPRFANIGSLFPDRLRVTLRYHATLNLILPASSGVVTYRFSGNSVFDPDSQLGGHQPYGYDSLAGIYNNYRVVSSRIKVTSGWEDSSNSHNGAMVIYPSAVSGTETNPALLPEIQRSRIKMFSPFTKHATISTALSTRKMYGRRDLSSDFDADIGNNPATQWYWHLALWNMDFADASTWRTAQTVQIWYNVEFYGRNVLPLS